MLLRVNPVLTTITVRRISRIKDLSRRRKGRLISLASSTTAIVRKATIKANIIPRSSIITYKDLDNANRRITLSELLRDRIRRL
jgi:hypothetical protein